MQTPGCESKALLLCDGAKIAQMAEFHAAKLSLFLITGNKTNGVTSVCASRSNSAEQERCESNRSFLIPDASSAVHRPIASQRARHRWKGHTFPRRNRSPRKSYEDKLLTCSYASNCCL